MTDLFGGGSAAPAKPKRKAAQAFSIAPDAPTVERPAEVMSADAYKARHVGRLDATHTTADVEHLRRTWDAEAALRVEIGFDDRDGRLMKAGMDGRCNRVRDGLAPIGRD